MPEPHLRIQAQKGWPSVQNDAYLMVDLTFSHRATRFPELLKQASVGTDHEGLPDHRLLQEPGAREGRRDDLLLRFGAREFVVIAKPDAMLQ